MELGEIRFRLQETVDGEFNLVGGTYGDREITEMLFNLSYEEAFEIASEYESEVSIQEVYGAIALTYMTQGLKEGQHIALGFKLGDEIK